MRQRDVAIIIVAVVVVLGILLALAGVGAYGWGMMGPGFYRYGVFPIWGILMALFMLIFWVAIIAAIVWLVVSLTRQGRLTSPGLGPGRPSALDILQERYARGEISREQYEQMRRDIEGSGGTPPP